MLHPRGAAAQGHDFTCSDGDLLISLGGSDATVLARWSLVSSNSCYAWPYRLSPRTEAKHNYNPQFLGHRLIARLVICPPNTSLQAIVTICDATPFSGDSELGVDVV